MKINIPPLVVQQQPLRKSFPAREDEDVNVVGEKNIISSPTWITLFSI